MIIDNLVVIVYFSHKQRIVVVCDRTAQAQKIGVSQAPSFREWLGQIVLAQGF